MSTPRHIDARNAAYAEANAAYDAARADADAAHAAYAAARAARTAAYAAADAAYDAAAARIAEAEALIRDCVEASATTDNIASVNLYGLTAEEAHTALSQATIDSDVWDTADFAPGLIVARGRDEYGHDWCIVIELREPGAGS